MIRLTARAAAWLLLSVLPAWAGDAASGERLFRTQCGSCHSVQPGRNMLGPSLFGVYGRAYGTAPGFRYPPAGQDAAVVWDERSLDRFLADPRSVLPRTSMLFAGLRTPAARADIVAYLQTLK